MNISNWILNTPNKRKTIGKKIYASLLEWEVERVCAKIVDNMSSNDVAINYVKNQMLMWKNSDAFLLHVNYMHVHYFAQILNLIVTEGLKELHASIAGI